MNLKKSDLNTKPDLNKKIWYFYLKNRDFSNPADNAAAATCGYCTLYVLL